MFGFGKKRPDDGTALTQPLPPGWEVVDLGLLGSGGMSRVYRVRDEGLGREVALKVLRPELSKEESAIARFVEEARITAQLDHPNIPAVYALSADRKRSTCFTMKVLEGQSLQQVLEENEREGVDGLFAALDVLVRVCDAVAFAHARGVLHLDLKPANVMVGEFGQIYLVDWGLARRKAELPTAEQNDGANHGTPAYMAPEQARGENHALDERTDLFALGGMLYRVLTGRPPYTGRDADAVLRAATQGVVAPPVKPGSSLPRRLVAICTKALSADPAQRYQQASELKTDLEEFMRGTAQLPQLTFKAGEPIVREGEAGDAAYIILEGHCQASRLVGGQQQPLRLLGPGEMFGETAVLTGAPRSATVTALADTTVGVVDQLSLHEEMERSTFMSLAMRTVASRFLDLDAQASALRRREQLGRAVELVLRQLALVGTAAPGGGRRVPWAPLLAQLVSTTGAAEAEVAEHVLRQPGFAVVEGQLVLGP
jgi:serine/threonine-protein kinase